MKLEIDNLSINSLKEILRSKEKEEDNKPIKKRIVTRYDSNKVLLEYTGELKNVDLTNVDLRFANLKNANLAGANLKNANLINADLTGANLESIDLTGANLRNANLTGANLRNTDLRNTITKYTTINFSSKEYEQAKQFIEGLK